MSLNELLPPNEDADFTRGEQEVIDPAEHYLRLYAKDKDKANEFLKGLGMDELKITVIRLSASAIENTVLAQYATGEDKREKLEYLIEEYKSLIRKALFRDEDNVTT